MLKSIASRQKKTPPRKGKAPTRILIFLTLCFGASVSFRVIETAVVASGTTTWRSAVQAMETSPEAESEMNLDEADDILAPEPEEQSHTPAAPMPVLSSNSCEPSVLMASLQEQERSIQERSTRLDAREKQLNVARKRIQERLKAMETANTQLQETMARVEGATQKDVQHLVDMYSKMKPKQAGAIFNTMQPSFAAGFMGEMRADIAAAILANMESEKAHAVSVVMAGRNASVPKE